MGLLIFCLGWVFLNARGTRLQWVQEVPLQSRTSSHFKRAHADTWHRPSRTHIRTSCAEHCRLSRIQVPHKCDSSSLPPNTPASCLPELGLNGKEDDNEREQPLNGVYRIAWAGVDQVMLQTVYTPTPCRFHPVLHVGICVACLDRALLQNHMGRIFPLALQAWRTGRPASVERIGVPARLSRPNGIAIMPGTGYEHAARLRRSIPAQKAQL